MRGIGNSILDTVGNTPVVRINNIAPPGVELFAKLEAFNPLGSVKDRLALGVIEAAERDGSLKPGQTVIEATSGNTGIGLAMVCAQKRYPLVVTMAENFSIERRKLMRFLGAKVILTPAAEGTGMVARPASWRTSTGGSCAPVRKRSQRGHAQPHDGRRDPVRFRPQRARLLGHRSGHRRHAEGCGARSQGAKPEHASRGLRARQFAAPRQRRRSTLSGRRQRGGEPARISTASDAGMVAGFHSEAGQ
jgi:hypothetical protein